MPSLFRDANGPCLPVGCHFGDGLSRWARGQQDAVEALLAAIAGAGYGYVRTWTVLDSGSNPYWHGRTLGPHVQGDAYWTHVVGYAAALRRHGLRWLVSQGDVLRVYTSTGDRVKFMERIADCLQREDVAGMDVANESGNNGESDPAKLEPMSWPIAQRWPDLALSLSSSQTEEVAEINALSPKPCTVFDVHGSRAGHWWDKVRHVFSIAYEGKPNRRLGMQSEPFGPGDQVSASDNKHELNAAVMQAGAVMSLLARQSWVYFCGGGIKSDMENITTSPGFAETPAAVAWLPKDIHAAELFHGGQTWASKRVFAAVNETRCDHALLADGRGACLIYGPSWSEVASRTPQRAVHVTQDVAFGTSARLVTWEA